MYRPDFDECQLDFDEMIVERKENSREALPAAFESAAKSPFLPLPPALFRVALYKCEILDF